MMGLLTIEEIQQGLDKIFLPLEPMLIGLRLLNGGASEQKISECEKELAIKFPSDFREALSLFNFGKLTIGPVAFCGTGEYLKKLVELNTGTRWWGAGDRPDNLLVIANSDPYTILLDANGGGVFAMDPEKGWQESANMARTFELFLRGLGTIMLRRQKEVDKEALAQSVLQDVGGRDLTFWHVVAK